MPDPVEIARQAEHLDDLDWFDFLDEVDAIVKRRYEQRPEEPDPSGEDRDEVAAWIARGYLIVDASVREVIYLPEGSSPGEIRFIVVNSRFTPIQSDGQVSHAYSSQELEEMTYLLDIVDVDEEQLGQIKSGDLKLPLGWSLENATIWGRRR